MTDRPLAVLIVAYRTPFLLEACLAAVAEHLPDASVHVLDNSAEHAAEVDPVEQSHPEAIWHRGGPNLGFAAAVNVLATTVAGHDLLLLNPDAVLQSPLTSTLAAMREPDVAVAAPLDVAASPAGAEAWDVAHRERTVISALVSAAGYASRLRGTPLSELYRTPPQDVDGYLTGACLAINRAAWDEIGSFDEEFFLYGEETEWQARARAAGWRLRLVDEPGIVHEAAGTTRSSSVAARRSGDLLRANIALEIGHRTSHRRADAYLAGTSLLDHLQRSKRRHRREHPRTDKPAVILTINRLVYGGAERHHVVLATELVHRGYDVTIVCLQRLGPLIAEVPHAVRVVRQPWWAPDVDLPDGPSILITGDTNTETGFGTLWRRRRRDRRWLVGAHVPPNADGPTYSPALARAMRRADGFIALSPRHREQLGAHGDVARHWFEVPNGVVHAADLGDVPSPPPLRDPLRLVMLSRIVEHKNPHLLVEALAGLPDLPWTLDIWGDGPDRVRLEALTPTDLRDRVRWRGWSAGPGPALAEADVVCLPSRAEAFPLTILEAMARRLPVIASSSCAVPDVLDHGAAGIVVDDVTVAGWRRALVDLFDRRADLSELADRGFERMREHYTIESMADGYEAAIRETMHR
ncbi:glycosyltransferase [Aeromicrobium sp. CF3.5]|uniref:glycosyltransferase n=1 Tax=Aeromicrobium sp. CF3.5 TaxID=3373078 RepID=UPI003EE4271D